MKNFKARGISVGMLRRHTLKALENAILTGGLPNATRNMADGPLGKLQLTDVRKP